MPHRLLPPGPPPDLPPLPGEFPPPGFEWATDKVPLLVVMIATFLLYNGLRWLDGLRKR